MFAAVLEWYRQRGTRPPPLRTGIIGGSPVSPALLRELQHEFALEDLGIAYGGFPIALQLCFAQY
jgi:hypothetical protein